MSKLLKIKGYAEQTCGGCPTIYEFDDIHGDHYYFRLRYGCWRLVNESKDEEIASGDNGSVLGVDGICSWEEATLLCASRQIFIVVDYSYDDEDDYED